MKVEFVFVGLLLAYAALVVRLISILPFFKGYSNGFDYQDRSLKVSLFEHMAKRPLRLFVFLGSGGHTGEMLRLIENYKRVLLAKGNTICVGFSDQKSKECFVRSIASKYPDCRFEYYQFKKAREVNASLLQSLISVLQTLLTSFKNVIKISSDFRQGPHLVLLNGPGTCCIIATWFKMLEFLNFAQPCSNLVYVESLARINTLSLTGKILYYLADVFIVQWQELTSQHPRAKCFGILV